MRVDQANAPGQAGKQGSSFASLRISLVATFTVKFMIDHFDVVPIPVPAQLEV